MYKYLLWDIDGTVLDFSASEAYAIRLLFKKYNIGECSDEMLKLYSEINSEYWNMLEKNERTKEEILVGRFEKFFEIIGVDISIAEKFNEEYQVTLGDHIEFIDKAKKTLLSQKGKYTLVAVTNGTKVAQEKKLRISGLDKIFDEIFISEDVGAEKPNKEYFDYVLKKLGVIDKNEVLLIGDRLTSDVKGGFIAGLDTCWFNPKHSENTLNIPVKYEIDDFDKLGDIVCGLEREINMTTLLLIRHGESEANRNKVFGGQINPDLQERGVMQAELTAKFIAENYEVDKIYSSDLKRAYRTAEPLSKLLNIEIKKEKRLREIYAGKWEGMKFDDLKRTYPDEYNVWLTDIGNAVCTDGETVKELSERISDSLTEIAEQNNGKTVVVTTHATPIRVIQSLIETGGLSEMKNIPWVTNASVTEITYNNGEWIMIKASKDEHLEELKTNLPANV